MTINYKKFFDTYRQQFGRILEHQVQPIQTLLEQIENTYNLSVPWAAYILATIKHETANTYLPIEEYGKGRKHKYGKPAGKYGHRYYGRGYIQLTWLFNYERQSKKFGVDLVQFPDEVMVPEIAWKICCQGMIDGDFTGKKLADYINKHRKDYRGARRIVNGLDKASKIAAYAVKFEKCLINSTEERHVNSNYK